MWKQAKEALETAGYTLKAGDEALLRLCAEYAEAGLLCECNLMDLPQELRQVCALRAIGAFFSTKQAVMPEDIENFPAEALERLKLGDTEVTFDVSGARQSAEQHMSVLVAGLLHYGRELAACCRRLPW